MKRLFVYALIFHSFLAYGSPACFDPNARLVLQAGLSEFASTFPLPPTKPVFRGPVLQIYAFMLHGKLGEIPMESVSVEKKVSVFKSLMDDIAAKHKGYENHGPESIGDMKVFFGVFGNFLVFYPNGELYMGLRNPINGRPNRDKPYPPEDMKRFLNEQQSALSQKKNIDGKLDLRPLDQYLRKSVESLNPSAGQ